MTDPGPVYLDYAATTPLDPAVLAAMRPWLEGLAGNPASAHAVGRHAAAAVAQARARVAGALGASADEIVWTSGATEADNLAIKGAARHQHARGRGDHLVTLATEHRAVLASCEALEREGFTVTRVPPESDGGVSAGALAAALTARTVLVSVSAVNNETGVIPDLAAIAERVKGHGALLHVDAAQALGRVSLDVSGLPADLVSLSAHKCYGPQGVGALYVRRRPRVRLMPLLHGGGQEGGLRPGTVPVAQVVGMGAAVARCVRNAARDGRHLEALRGRLLAGLAEIGGVILNGRRDGSPHIVNVSFPGVHGAALAGLLDGLAVSAGSACAAAVPAPSHVLRAMGRPDALAHASLRLSLGGPTTAGEVDRAVAVIGAAVGHLRGFSPVWQRLAAGETIQSVYGTRTPLVSI
ncbi:Cysteine desulfurase IscS [wastewater metagenome]|uniref:Cysteine desulfurase IscS n=2 Tax=unclassified sequences TaxID=12908 RepID=A0A5B8RFT7_9ZZZZ|nr:cysteine desulfurase family protein [Arhodomonas aquaeolei]QEA05695.1 cysteine desulfurase IscS [uncultured organism]